MVTDGKTGYVIEPRDPIALAQTIIKFFEKNKEVEFREEIKREKERFSWDRMIEHIEKLYQGD